MDKLRPTPLFLKKAIQLWAYKREELDGLFHDPLYQRLTLIIYPHVYVFQEIYPHSDPNPIYFILPNNVDKHIIACTISQNDSYISLQTKPNEVSLVDYTRYQVPFICKITTNSSNPIIGIHYMQSTKYDFLTIEVDSLHLYKFTHKEKKTSLTTIKTIVTSISNYYIDPHKCIVVLTSNENRALMQPFYFKNDENNLRDIKGVEYSIKYPSDISVCERK